MKKRWGLALLTTIMLLQTVQADTNKYYPSGRSPLLATKCHSAQ